MSPALYSSSILARSARYQLLPTLRRSFQATSPVAVKVGDRIPSLKVLQEGSPGNKVDLAKEISNGKALIVGVPGAFSPSCSESHIPGYIAHPKLPGAGKVFVVSVNDAFVMKAWQNLLDPQSKSGIRFLADPSTAFSSALDLTFDAPAVFGGLRGKRYALVVEDGVVKEAYVESDNTGMNVSVAEKVLKWL